MGAYLSEPMTQKESEDGDGNKLKFGACSMQGWRISQEDAHNCIAKFDENSSLFAVYDGHGGAEVAQFLSRHLPDMLKQCDAYKNGEFVKALEECYLKIDASIKTPEVLKEIQKLAKSNDKGDNEEAAVDYEEENVGKLYEEATMPLDKLVAKYASGTNEEGSAGNTTEEDPSCKPGSSKSMCSPGSSSSAGTSKAGGSRGSSSSAAASSLGASSSCTSNNAGESSSSSAACSSVKVNGESSGSSSSTTDAKPSEELKTETVTDDKSNSELELVVEGKKIELELSKPEEMQIEEIVDKGKENTVKEGSSEIKEPAPTSEVNGDKVVISENGVSKSKEAESESKKLSENDEQKSTPVVNGGGGDSASPNGGNAASPVVVATSPETPRRKKVHPVPMAIPEESKQEKRSSPRKTGRPISFLPAVALDCSDSEDSEDDAGYNLGDKDSEDSSELEDEEEELGEDSDDDDDDDDEYEDEEEEEDERFLSEMQEPGYDSGATAVVCFMKWEADGLSLWVANAGDSRCVVCREGKAIDMSHDHKPELDVEAQRIVKAGGKVTEDGRVNGGLNLSRALGDHSYKQNQTLPPEEQMISPLPSVENIVLNPSKDRFMVLACDGIWNSMSSQEVVDFVAERLEKSEKLSKICEELFDSCLSPDTCGDGTGCDNMTCIIVKLSDAPEIYSGSKRKLSPSEATEEVSKDESAESTKKCRLGEAAPEESS